MAHEWVIRKWRSGTGWIYLAGIRQHAAVHGRTYSRKASKSASWTTNATKAVSYGSAEDAMQVVYSQRLSSAGVVTNHLEVNARGVTR